MHMAAPGTAPRRQRLQQRLLPGGNGGRRSWRQTWPLLGPAFIAAIAYVDPGIRDRLLGRRQLWIPTALGDPGSESHGNAHPSAYRQARCGDQSGSGDSLPRTASSAGRLGLVAPSRSGGSRHRPRRGCRRRHRAEPAVRSAAAYPRGPHGDRRLLEPRRAVPGIPGRSRRSLRACLLSLVLASPTPSCVRSRCRFAGDRHGAGVRRNRQHATCNGHPGRNCDAARHLRVLRADSWPLLSPRIGRRP